MAPTDRAIALSALWAGQLAGAAFLAFLLLVAIVFLGPPLPPAIIGAFFTGSRGAGSFVLGVIANQAVAAAWALVFAFVLRGARVPPRHPTVITLSLAVGALAASVDVYLLLPPVNMVLHGEDVWWRHVPWIWSWSAHLLYGLALGFWYLAAWRRVGPAS